MALDTGKNVEGQAEWKAVAGHGSWLDKAKKKAETPKMPFNPAMMEETLRTETAQTYAEMPAPPVDELLPMLPGSEFGGAPDFSELDIDELVGGIKPVEQKVKKEISVEKPFGADEVDIEAAVAGLQEKTMVQERPSWMEETMRGANKDTGPSVRTERPTDYRDVPPPVMDEETEVMDSNVLQPGFLEKYGIPDSEKGYALMRWQTYRDLYPNKEPAKMFTAYLEAERLARKNEAGRKAA